MKAEGTVRIRFPSEDEARTAAAALEPDNDGHLEARVEGDVLVLAGDSRTVLGIVRTFDDALGCLRAMGVE